MFLTLLTPLARERVISVLSTEFAVKQVGWTKANPGCNLCVLHVHTTKKVVDEQLDTYFEGIFTLLRDADVQYHSAVLVDGTSWWQQSNIDYSRIEEEKEDVGEKAAAAPGRYSLITQPE